MLVFGEKGLDAFGREVFWSADFNQMALAHPEFDLGFAALAHAHLANAQIIFKLP